MFVTHHAVDFSRAIHQLAKQIAEQFEADCRTWYQPNGSILLVGIRTCGAHIAQRLQEHLFQEMGAKPDMGILDISLYRDDVLSSLALPQLKSTSLPSSIDDRYIVLVDDVFYTGRTARAGLQALLDFGRPACVRLAVMVERGHRELPLAPDFKAIDIHIPKDQRVEVCMTEEGFENDAIVRLGSSAC